MPGAEYLEIPPSTTALPELPPFRTPTSSPFFHTKAPLTNISEVRVRRHNGRCLGMYLSYADSSSEALGQWDPTDTDSILKIYDAIDGVLNTLVFYTRLEDDCLKQPQIERVSAEVSPNTSQPWVPREATSDLAGIHDPESASMGELAPVCRRCRRSKCRDPERRRRTMVKAFPCSQPGQVSKRSFE